MGRKKSKPTKRNSNVDSDVVASQRLQQQQDQHQEIATDYLFVRQSNGDHLTTAQDSTRGNTNGHDDGFGNLGTQRERETMATNSSTVS
jgi:hypothetical protein